MDRILTTFEPFLLFLVTHAIARAMRRRHPAQAENDQPSDLKQHEALTRTMLQRDPLWRINALEGDALNAGKGWKRAR
jgi:hypothetical protein